MLEFLDNTSLELSNIRINNIQKRSNKAPEGLTPENCAVLMNNAQLIEHISTVAKPEREETGARATRKEIKELEAEFI